MAQQRGLGWDGEHDSLRAASPSPLLQARAMGQRLDTLAATVRRDARLAAFLRSLSR